MSKRKKMKVSSKSRKRKDREPVKPELREAAVVVVEAEVASEAAKSAVNSNTANPANLARKAVNASASVARMVNVNATTTPTTRMVSVNDSVARNAPRRLPLLGSLHRHLRKHPSPHQSELPGSPHGTTKVCSEQVLHRFQEYSGLSFPTNKAYQV